MKFQDFEIRGMQEFAMPCIALNKIFRGELKGNC